MVQLLLDRKADINKRGQSERPPLHLAVISCHDDIVLLLIKNGADVNAKKKNSETALMDAVQVCPAAARTLVENKADVNAKDKNGHTALMDAVEMTAYESVYNPEKHFDDRSRYRSKEGVLIQDRYDMVKYLLDHGADPNVKGSSWKTPLRIAKFGRPKEVVHLLEKYHARE